MKILDKQKVWVPFMLKSLCLLLVRSIFLHFLVVATALGFCCRVGLWFYKELTY